MTFIDQHTAVAILRPIDLELRLRRGSKLTMDDGRNPYITGRLVCEMPADEDRDAIDPRDGIRLDLRLRRGFGAPWPDGALTALTGGSVATLTTLLAGGNLSSLTNRLARPWNGGINIPAKQRSFALVVYRRVLDEARKTMTLDVAGLDHLLHRDILAGAPLDAGSLDLATIAAGVLERYGETLAPDSSTAMVTEPDAVIWEPGTSAFRYLDTLLETASLRLWADEEGTFRITERQTPVEGSAILSPSNLVDLTDTIALDDPEVYADAVEITYTSNDGGVAITEYDYAGAQPSLVGWAIARTGRKPAAGAAAGILSRMEGRGRQLELVADSDYELSPGMPVTINPPVGESSVGYLGAVEFDLAQGEMTVQTRGLVDISIDAYLYGSDSVTCASVAAGAHPDMTCADFDWSVL